MSDTVDGKMDENKVLTFLGYFKSKKIKEKKCVYFIETLCVWGLLKGRCSEHINSYTKYLASKINYINQ